MKAIYKPISAVLPGLFFMCIGQYASAGYCRDLYTQSRAASKSVIKVSGATKYESADLRKLIPEMHENELQHFREPPRLEIRLHGQITGFFPAEGQLALETQAVPISKSSRGLNPLLNHEYGHVVFYENFSNFSHEWKWVMSDYAVKGRMKSPNKAANYKVFAELDHISESYQEFFSDLVTAVRSGNPEVIRDALNEAGLLSPFNENRSFLKKIPIENWNEEDPHRALAPLYSHVWEVYTSRERTNQQKADFLWEIFEIIGEEILDRHKNGLMVMPPAEMNRRFLERLELRMAGPR
ncbi:MAG: hypothetical protein AB7O96_14380 [Pseudobdellovibrionaceae bacterium]